MAVEFRAHFADGSCRDIRAGTAEQVRDLFRNAPAAVSKVKRLRDRRAAERATGIALLAVLLPTLLAACTEVAETHGTNTWLITAGVAGLGCYALYEFCRPWFCRAPVDPLNEPHGDSSLLGREDAR